MFHRLYWFTVTGLQQYACIFELTETAGEYKNMSVVIECWMVNSDEVSHYFTSQKILVFIYVMGCQNPRELNGVECCKIFLA